MRAMSSHQPASFVWTRTQTRGVNKHTKGLDRRQEECAEKI